MRAVIVTCPCGTIHSEDLDVLLEPRKHPSYTTFHCDCGTIQVAVTGRHCCANCRWWEGRRATGRRGDCGCEDPHASVGFCEGEFYCNDWQEKP